MDAAELAELAKRDLAPLLAANASERVPPRARRRLGGRDAPGNVPWVGIPGGNEIALSRSLPLTPWEAGILQPYGEALSELQGVPDGVARNAKDDVVLRALASQLGGADRATLEAAMRFLLACASTTYEGQPVHLSLLVDLDDPGAVPTPVATLDALRSHDWYALLGSGIDAGIELNAAGGIKGAIDVRHLAPEANGTLIDESLRPDAFRCLAEWATNGRRVALTLARSREILIHTGGILRYIHRSGRWRDCP